ncbi:MAG: glycerate kinase [Gammaproteobacteria bacterium]|nr:glycerate kinase [Gammaproteobacteria bacterium]
MLLGFNMAKKHYKIIIAPDSFKGSASAKEVANAIKSGLENNINLDIEAISLPIADGGEGTLDAIVKDENKITVSVRGPLGDKIDSEYGFIGKTAVIEMAKAAGLTLISKEKRIAFRTNTYGVGELINDAINRGFRDFLITLGGSATNDGGCGMFAALGAKFYNKYGMEFVPAGGTLIEIDRINIDGLNPLLKECSFTIATDVTNELYGRDGATMVYGRQKGASLSDLDEMEEGMKEYSKLLKSMSGIDVNKVKGSGAAGGMASPLLAFFNAKIQSGIDSVLKAIDFDELIKDADIIITGEGKIDRQSLFGKAISGVAKSAKKYNIPVYCFVGSIGDDINEIKKLGISDVYSVFDFALSIEDSISNATKYLYEIAYRFADCLKDEKI